MSLIQTPKFMQAWSQTEEIVLNYAITSDQWNWVLDLISWARSLRKLSLKFYETDASFIQRLSSGKDLNRLEELSLGSVTLTVEGILSLLSKNRDTLRSLSIQQTTLVENDKWPTIFENMKGQFRNLQNLILFWFQPMSGKAHVIFSKLLKYPMIPGSEGFGPNGRLKHDSRRIESTEDTVKVSYWGLKRVAVGMEYHGQGVDHVLGALADTEEVI